MNYSWQSTPAAPSPSLSRPLTGPNASTRLRALAARLPRPELLALLVLTAVLNLWALSKNGFANDYYSGAVRSMSASWHNFLFASADPSGVMTVDKPPLALWVQALSVRVFGYHPLSILLPQALMGVVSVALLYDLVRRRFGRLAGFAGGVALALTPITVAISRHNNPDALLVLCCVAALWFAVRALEEGRTRWLVLAGVAVGLGFETKMLVALVVVPGIALAYLWVAPRGRLRALRQLLAGGAAMTLVGGAWPLLVALTPAANRPWISGTADNNILSLIFEYNGLGRVDGQAGGPAGAGPGGAGPGGGNLFGGGAGPLRLLNSALGGQAGWLLGFAIVSALGLLVATRLRRADERTGWLVAVGGAFATTAVLFSAASGIFHPYYVSLLAPFAAALVGAGAAQLLTVDGHVRVFAPLALAAGVATELAVLHDYPGQLSWLPPLLIAVCAIAGLALVLLRSRRGRIAAAIAGLAVLLLAPSVWAVDTLGHATNGTFPEGGPGNLQTMGSGFGPRFGSVGRGFRSAGGVGSVGGPPAGAVPLFGNGASGSGATPRGSTSGGLPGAPGRVGGMGTGAFAGPGGPMGGQLSSQVLSYVKQHGGGTIAVSSQSSAASAIVASGAKIAGIGGFSGRESEVTATWLAQRVRAGAIRWVLAEQSGSGGMAGFGGAASTGRGLPGDTRKGSKAAMAAVTKACTRVTLSGESEGSSLYDCAGRASALERVGA
ncbi:MAG TPA: glycosyltransferase family 39 protein [Solirubrobacteraceae bacterium]|nr:glycosyltransferase family 39 protein [Solirubrobacteraceae bacterium]